MVMNVPVLPTPALLGRKGGQGRGKEGREGRGEGGRNGDKDKGKEEKGREGGIVTLLCSVYCSEMSVSHTTFSASI